jgi:hypothetical protein
VKGLTPIKKVDASDLVSLNAVARATFMSFNDEELRLMWIEKHVGSVKDPGTFLHMNLSSISSLLSQTFSFVMVMLFLDSI